MQNLNDTRRDAYWDNAKFFLICLVVVGHFVAPFGGSDYYWPHITFLVIYTIHMPLFIFISGMFSKSAIDKGRILPRVISFLVVYVVYKIAKKILLNGFLGESVGLKLFIADDLSWYMLLMALWLIATYVFKDMKPVILMAVSIMLAFTSGFASELGDIMALSRFFVYWPFYLLGYYLNKDDVQGFLDKKPIRLVGIVILIAFVFAVWYYLDFYETLGKLFTGRNSFEAVAKHCDFFHPAFRFVYYPYIVVVGIGFLSAVPRSHIPIITNMGKNTLQVYFIHRLALYVVRYFGYDEFLFSVFPEEKYWTMALIASGLVMAFVLSIKIFSPPFDFIMRQKYSCIMKRDERS